MRRLLLLLLTAVAMVSCDDTREHPMTPITGSPQATIFDGTAPGGNPHFYWLPELANSPSPTGIFQGDLPAEVRLCRLNGRGPNGDGIGASCVADTETVLFDPSQLTVDPIGEHYSSNWKTSDSNLYNGEDYRLSVYVGSTQLGYRDLNPEENSPSPIDKAAPFYAFKNGNTISIKFRIEEEALCDSESESCGVCLLQTDGTGGNNPDFFSGEGDESACNADAGLGVRIPQAALTEPTLVIVERVDCGAVTDDGRVNFFEFLDIPQYGGCFTARTDPVLQIEDPADYAIAAVCVDPVALENLTESQVANLALHKTEDADVEGEIVVLNNVAASFVDCEEFYSQSASPLLGMLRDAWRRFSPLGVEPLYARHLGVGGETPTFSDFVWALPSQIQAMEPLSQTALAGSPVTPPAVKVTDESDNPVQGARVTFELVQNVGDGSIVPASPAVVTTGPDGMASPSAWTLGTTPGLNVVTAGGLGLGVKDEEWTAPDGRTGVGPFSQSTVNHVPAGASNNDPIPLQRGGVEFTAFGCELGSGTASVDGTKGAGEWYCANTEPFIANLGGGKKDATFYWMRNGQTFYFAVEIPVDESAAEKINVLTLYLNVTGASSLTSGDDVLILDGAAADPFSDQHWTSERCPRGQSFCAVPDGEENGTGAFRVNTRPDGSAFYFYEIEHTLDGHLGHDVSFAGALGVALTLRVGNGIKGNTEWPGPFGVYKQLLP